MSIFFHPTWKADSRFLIRWLYNKHPETFPLRIYSVTCSQVELCPQHASTRMCFRKREIFISECITNLRCLLIKNIVVFILATDLISINFIMKMYYNCIFKTVVRKNSRVLLEKKNIQDKRYFLKNVTKFKGCSGDKAWMVLLSWDRILCPVMEQNC